MTKRNMVLAIVLQIGAILYLGFAILSYFVFSQESFLNFSCFVPIYVGWCVIVLIVMEIVAILVWRGKL
jgi:hypothetical protein